MFSKIVVALFASATLVAGHGRVDKIVADGKYYVGTQNWNSPENKNSPVRMIPQDTGFVDYRKVNTMDIACSSAGYAGTPVTAPVAAGSTVDIRWAGDKGPSGNIWPHPEGPELAYLANCNGDCSTFDPRNAKFFKIQEAGLDTSKRPIQNWIDHKPAGDGLWIQNKAMMEDGWFHVTIPKDIADGNYLLRHELISLHGAHSRAEGAQYYPICIQIQVHNGGSSKPAGIPATQLYTQEDGIVDIWAPFPNGIKNYKIPGPAIYAAGKSTEPAPPAPAPPAATTTRVSTSAPTPTKPAGNGKPSSSPYNNNNAAVTSASVAPAKPSIKLCKPKPARAAKRSSVEDETRELYDRALTRSRARRAHAQHGSGSF